MAERAWTDPWPAWSRRWFGIALRVLAGGLGTFVGLALIMLANFGATFKKDQPEWDGESLTILFLGLATILTAIAVAVRPSRLTVAFALVTAVAIPLVGSII